MRRCNCNYNYNCCNRPSCCCNGIACPEIKTETVCTCTRYVDVPMHIYYGSGYTEVDCCEDTLEVLRDISSTLDRMAPASRPQSCGGNRCCNNSCGNWCWAR